MKDGWLIICPLSAADWRPLGPRFFCPIHHREEADPVLAARLLTQYGYDVCFAENAPSSDTQSLWRKGCSVTGVVDLCKSILGKQEAAKFSRAFYQAGQRLGRQWATKARHDMDALAEMGFTNASVLCYRGEKGEDLLLGTNLSWGAISRSIYLSSRYCHYILFRYFRSDDERSAVHSPSRL